MDSDKFGVTDLMKPILSHPHNVTEASDTLSSLCVFLVLFF